MQYAESSKIQKDFIKSLFPEKLMNASTEKACGATSSILTRFSTESSLLALETIAFDIVNNFPKTGDLDERIMAGKEIFKTLESDRLTVFTGMLRPFFVERDDDLKVALPKVLYMPKCAYVSSCRALASRDKERSCSIHIFDDGWRVVQRAVAAKSFYGFCEDRCSTALVSGESPERLTCKSTSRVSV